jgi:hypothetical protein
MRRQYDIYELMEDGSPLWRCCVIGKFEAERKLLDLSEHSTNEFFAIEDSNGHERLSLIEGQLRPSVRGANG